VAVFGTGEAAELAYLSIAELGLELVAVFDHESGGRFLGRPVRHIHAHRDVEFDLLIVAMLSNSEPLIAELREMGVDEHRMVPLR
jgi:hypothetical protein